MSREGPSIKQYIKTALRLSLLYVLFAWLWIVFSDRVLALLVVDTAMLTEAQTFKGSAFVIVTGILVFFTLKREFRARQLVEEELARHRDKLEDIVKERTDELNIANKEIARLENLHLVGEMAAGIGHEIRNPMTAVRGFLQILMNKIDCAKYNDYFEVMIEELDHANSIITEYLTLAKNRNVDLKPNSLNNILDAIYPLLVSEASVSGHDIEMDSGDIPDLLLDEKEIRQLILNLVRNGFEAMSPGDKIIVKTFSENDKVVLAIKDQGTGIKQEIMDKIGTPFFTSKDQGTGLGLAICYSIAARHNATIKIETGDIGTTFFVIFEGPVN